MFHDCECGRGHGTVWSSEYQQKSLGCKYVEISQTMQKKILFTEECCGNEGRFFSSVISEIIKIQHKYVGPQQYLVVNKGILQNLSLQALQSKINSKN